MLEALARGLPEARVDLLIRAEEQAPLLEDFPNVGRVYCLPRRLPALFGLRRRLRRRRYDLAVDPCTNSTNGRLGLALSGRANGWASPAPISGCV